MEYTSRELEILHKTLMFMMERVKDVCDKNNIRYFLVGGTLLGAVRHKGFIPWDDDFDIGMLRSDYEKFMAIADKELGPDMFVENYDTCKGYGHVFGKVMLKGTVWNENFTQNVDCHKNIYIDVFPIDVTTANPVLSKLQFSKAKVVARMLLLNRNYKYTKTGVKYILYRIGYYLSGKFTKEFLVNQWRRTATKYSNTEKAKSKYVSMAGVYSIDKESYGNTEFDSFIEVPFENLQLTIPANYDLLLKRAYGDYMQLPPEEKRVAKHNIVKMDFGKYESLIEN